jgi:hypothetical protein
MKQAIKDRKSQQSSRTGRVVYGDQNYQSRQIDQLRGIKNMVNKTADSGQPSKYSNNTNLNFELVRQQNNGLQERYKTKQKKPFYSRRRNLKLYDKRELGQQLVLISYLVSLNDNNEYELSKELKNQYCEIKLVKDNSDSFLVMQKGSDLSKDNEKPSLHG